MIERLYPSDYPFGGAECTDIESELEHLSAILSEKLNEDGQATLEKLSALWHRQANLMLKDAFKQGFCAAFKLMRETFGGE